MRSFRHVLVGMSCLVLGLTTAWAQKKENDKSPPTDPNQFVEWVIKAHGGEAKLAKTSTATRRLYCAVESQEKTMVPFYLDNVWVMPDKYRVRFQTPFVTQMNALAPARVDWSIRESVLNGDKAWHAKDGQAAEITGSDLAAFKEQVYAEDLCRLLPLRESRFELKILDDVEQEERVFAVLEITCKGHKVVNLYFDKKTGLLYRMQHPVLTSSGVYSNQDVYFRDYKDLSGLKYWRRVTVITEGGYSYEGELIDLRFDKIPDEYFALPKAKTDKEKEKK